MAAAPIIAGGAALVGAGISIYGSLEQASDQASLDQEKAQVADEQSQEIASREAANETLRNQAAYRQKLEFGAAYAGSGKAGTGIGSQLEIQRQTDEQNMISARDASFQENMLGQQAGIDTNMAQETENMGTLNAIGQGISAVSSAASLGMKGFGGGTQGLPSASFG